MATYCYNQKELIQEAKLQLENHSNGIMTEIDEAFPVTEEMMDNFKSITKDLKSEHGANPVPYSSLMSKIVDIYKPDTEKALKALTIFQMQSVLHSNKNIRDAFIDLATTKSVTTKAYNEYKDLRKIYKGRNFPLDTYSLGDLKSLLAKAIRWISPKKIEVESVDKNGNIKIVNRALDKFDTLWGKMIISGMPLTKLSEIDPTGAVATIDKGAKGFYQHSERDKRAWLKADTIGIERSLKEVLRDRGIDDIYGDLSYVLEDSKIMPDNDEITSKIDGLFFKLNSGEILILDDKMMIYSKWGDLLDENGEVRTFNDTGDKMKGFDRKSLMPIEEYIEGKSLSKIEKEYFDKEDGWNANVRNALRVRDLYIPKLNKNL